MAAVEGSTLAARDKSKRSVRIILTSAAAVPRQTVPPPAAKSQRTMSIRNNIRSGGASAAECGAPAGPAQHSVCMCVPAGTMHAFLWTLPVNEMEQDTYARTTSCACRCSSSSSVLVHSLLHLVSACSCMPDGCCCMLLLHPYEAARKYPVADDERRMHCT